MASPPPFDPPPPPERPTTWEALDDALTRRTGQAPNDAHASVADIRAGLSSAGEAPDDMNVAFRALVARLGAHERVGRSSVPRVADSSGESGRGAGAPGVRGGFGFGKQTLPNRATYWLSFVGAILLGVIGVHLFANSGRGPSQKLSVRSYATVAGQQATVTLADGSRALLGPATTLSITTQPSDASMDVHVIGQALFTVAHSQRRPFRVHTGHAVARVLGTTFMVRQYTTDHVARVVVTEGRVSLSSARGAAARTTSRVLLASMMGTVNDSGNVQVTPNIVAEDYTAWTTGHVVFNKTPAREAVVELSRVYGVDIRITDSTLATQQLTWTIPVAKQSLSVVLVSLVGLLDAHTVQTGRVITLVPGRSASRRPVRPITPSASERQYGK